MFNSVIQGKIDQGLVVKLGVVPITRGQSIFFLHICEGRSSQKVSKLEFQSEFSLLKIIRTFLILLPMKNQSLGAHFCRPAFLIK